MKRIFKYLKSKKGITLVLMAFMLAVLLMLAGLAIDIAYMYYVKNQLQVAADASALAGAAELAGEIDDIILNPNVLKQMDARREAWKFACKNRAAGDPVLLVSQGANCDNPPNSNLNEDTNADTNDIVVGHWRLTNDVACSTTWKSAGSGYFCPANGSTGLQINAMQTRPRRTGETPGMPRVSLFIGQIFSLIGADWSAMSASASAIASPQPLATPGIPLCLPTCTAIPAGGTLDLIIQKDPQKTPINDGMAWTAFNCKQAPNIGAGGDVVDYIWGRKEIQIVCDLCLTTNNAPGEALKELRDAFESTTYRAADKDFNSSGKVIRWRVAVPVLDKRCTIVGDDCMQSNPNNLDCPKPNCCDYVTCSDPLNPNCCICPPGSQGDKSERHHVAQVAELHIISVNTSGNKRGITVDYIDCIGCPTSIPLGKRVALVK